MPAELKNYKKLSELLLDKGVITPAQAEEISLKMVKSGESEESIIRSMRLFPEEDFLRYKAEFLKIPFVDLD